MIKVLVTGANGLLGQKLVRLLDSDNEIEIIATSRGKLSVSLARGRHVPLDITNQVAVDKLITFVKPQFVVNAAAMTQVDDCETEKERCWLNNVTAVEYLANACKKNDAHLIHISTDFIFDGTHGPLDETAKPNPLSYYGQSKLAAEEFLQKSTTTWAILRTVLVYGVTEDMSRSNIVLWVKKSLEDRKKINVVDDQWRTPTLAEDLAMGCLLAIKKKAKGIFHISGDEMMTPYDIAIRTAVFFNLDKNLIQKTDSTQFRQPAMRPPKTGFIIEKARRELGYRPHTFAEGLGILASQMH